MPWSLLQRAATWLGSKFLSEVFPTSPPGRDPVPLPTMETAQRHPPIVPISLASLLSEISEWYHPGPLRLAAEQFGKFGAPSSVLEPLVLMRQGTGAAWLLPSWQALATTSSP